MKIQPTRNAKKRESGNTPRKPNCGEFPQLPTKPLTPISLPPHRSALSTFFDGSDSFVDSEAPVGCGAAPDAPSTGCAVEDETIVGIDTDESGGKIDGGEMADATDDGEMADATDGGEMADATDGGEMADATDGGEMAEEDNREEGYRVEGVCA
ncbi:hypothetical protein L6R29_00095 [Myxococcota bacterium]|nr:hypothetical protein [Myxococcota bacterium]